MAKAIPAAISAAGGIAAGLMQGGKGGGGVQTQTTQTKLPDWVENAAMENWGRATDLYYTMKGPYEGQRVAGLTPEQQNIIQQLYGNIGATNQGYNQARDATSAAMGYTPSFLRPGMLAQANLAPYMNPYTQQVIDPSMALFEQQRRQGINQIGDQAVQARAFGGSRQGVAEGVTNAQSALQAGQFGANLYSQNFLNAQQQAVGDIQRQYAADVANRDANYQAAVFRGSMANQLAGL